MMIRKLNWVGFTTVGIAAFLLGLGAGEIIGISKLDSEVASLLGAALGASITVFGAMWIAKHQSTEKERSFSKFVSDSVTAIRDEAYILVSLLEKNQYQNAREYANEILSQIARLRETFNLFENNSPFSNVGNYEARRSIFRLELEIQKNMRIFEKEEKWLQNPTDAVIENSRADLRKTADEIFMACVHVNGDLGFKPSLPADDELKRRFELISE